MSNVNIHKANYIAIHIIIKEWISMEQITPLHVDFFFRKANPLCLIMPYGIMMNTGSANRLLPDGSQLLPEPMWMYH